MGSAPTPEEPAAVSEGLGQADQRIRQAIHFCWLSLPKDRKNVDELKKQARRIFDRALRDFREDREQYGRLA